MLKKRLLQLKKEREIHIRQIIANDKETIIDGLNFRQEYGILNRLKRKVELAKNESAALILQKVFRMFKVRKQFKILVIFDS